MTWSYDPEMGAPTDKVRLLVADTNSTLPLLENEEISFFLTENGSNIYRAASAICYQLATRFASIVDKQVGDLRLSSSQKASNYLAAAKAYAKRGGASIPAAAPWIGGMSRSDKLIDQQSPDLIQPYFKLGQMSQPPGDNSDNSRDAGLWR